MKICSVGSCGRISRCKDFCYKHYHRFHKTGDPLGMKRPRYRGIKCKIKFCRRQAEDNWMCGKHAQRVKRWGDPSYITPEIERRKRSRLAQPKLGQLKSTTYKKYLGRHEHRRIAEKILGRRLRKGEIVHHKDHNKHNNDPSNLEVMTQSEHINRHRVGGKLVAGS